MPASTRLGLTRDRILDAAAALLARGAPPTMRAIAEQLDVTPMALYKWFADKDDLLDALVARVDLVPIVPPSGDAPWAERAFGFAADIRRTMLDHLPLLQVEGAGRRLAATMYRAAEDGLRLMLELGHRDQTAVDTYRVLFWAVLHHCLVIDAGGALPGAANPNAISELAALNADEHLAATMPTLAAHLHHFDIVDADAFFASSIRTVLAGIEATAPRRTAPRKTTR